MPRPQRTAIEKALVGPAGEHYVLHKLYRHGLMASLAPPGSPMIDILVLSVDETVVATIQVKTRTFGKDQGWHMQEKHERFSQARSYYAFVDLEPAVPLTYIVPSGVVATVVREAHHAWLNTPGKGGKPHADSSFRRLAPEYDFDVPSAPPGWLGEYLEAWNLITSDLPSAESF